MKPLVQSISSWRIRLFAILMLAAVLRIWGQVAGNLVEHPDEFSFVHLPLGFFSGDFNPHFFTYPTLHYYLLAVLYCWYFVFQHLSTSGYSLEQFILYYFIRDPDQLLMLARWVSVCFSIGTVWWSARLASVVYHRKTGWIAPLLLAVCVIHVRQTPLAAVDVPMTFWFTGGIWAAVRLLQRERVEDYLLAGALVGLAAATKYPGGLAGASVVAAHLLARRSPLDRRLWLSGLASLGTFALVSPYVLLDFDAFWQNFSFQAGHLRQGRANLGFGWWYHLRISLRYGLGWMGTALAAAAVVQAIRRPRREVWVVIISSLVYLVVMGAGKLVFVRYVLPLMALQIALVAGVIQSVHQRWWQILLVALVVLEPLYGSMRVAQLLGYKDTRVEAREWIEANVPAGTTCCNFGGWGGDVPLRTFEELGWRIKHFERVFKHRIRKETWFSLIAGESSKPAFSYAVQTKNRQLESGSLGAIDKLQCDYVILHRHPLSSSRVDSIFYQEMKKKSRRIAHFAPRGLSVSAPIYDPIDAYYIPIGDWGELGQPGPEVEVWRVLGRRETDEQNWSSSQLLARGYVEAADLMRRYPEQALAMIEYAVQLDPESASAHVGLGNVYRRVGQREKALKAYQRAIAIDSSHVNAYTEMGFVYADLGQYQAAIDHWQHCLEYQPHFADLYFNIGLAHYYLQRYDRAVDYFRNSVQMRPIMVDTWHGLGRIYTELGLEDEAKYCFEQASKIPSGSDLVDESSKAR